MACRSNGILERWSKNLIGGMKISVFIQAHQFDVVDCFAGSRQKNVKARQRAVDWPVA